MATLCGHFRSRISIACVLPRLFSLNQQMFQLQFAVSSLTVKGRAECGKLASASTQLNHRREQL